MEAETSTNGFTRYLDIPLYEMKTNVNRYEFNEFVNFQDTDYYLAETLQPTTNGVHVNITYQLSIKLHYGTYCADQPGCTIPLFIQAPPLPNFQKVEAPQGWNPTVYDQANFALPVPETELKPQQEEEYNPNNAQGYNENSPLMGGGQPGAFPQHTYSNNDPAPNYNPQPPQNVHPVSGLP